MVRPDYKTERNQELFELHLKGWTRAQLVERYGISEGRVSQIILAEKAKLPPTDRAEMVRRMSVELDRARELVVDVMEAPPPAAMSQGKPIPLRTPDGELDETRVAADASARLDAARVLAAVQARQSKLLGLDEPERVSSVEKVTVVIEGVDPNDV
jgi:transcriptional regulator with XRE-family HTH domain